MKLDFLSEKKIFPILLILSFAFLIFLKPTLYDMDSYYFYSLSCHGKVFRPDIDSFFIQYIFPNLPCNLIAFKTIIVAIFSMCVFISNKIGKLVSEKYSHWLFYLFGISLTFYSYFSKIEDDTLGLPFVFGTLYYLVKYSQSKKIIDYLIACGIVCLGFLFWKGIAIWGLIVLCVGPIGWIFSGIIFWLKSVELLPPYFPNVSEQLPFAGILSNGLVLVGGLLLPNYFIPSVSLAFMLAMLKLKYSLYLGLLCSLGLYFYMVKRSFFEEEVKKVFGFNKNKAFLGLLVVINLVSIIGVYSSPPSEGLVSLVEKVSMIARDDNVSLIFNDWELGHLVSSNRLTPSNEYGPPTPDFFDKNGFVISRQILSCKLIGSSDGYFGYDCRN